MRYYAVEAAENGAKACSMIYSTFAESVPEDFGISPPAPKYARGTSCSAVVTAIFRHFHRQILARMPKLKIARIRVKEHRGVAILSFGAAPPREFTVAREGRTWKIMGIVDSQLP
jgi:hypothetical protein